MFTTEVNLRARAASSVQAPRGIVALAVDPGSDLDVCRLGGGSILRPGGLWQPTGRPPGNVPVEGVRYSGSSDCPDAGIITLQVFEPGDVVVAPPKRNSKSYPFVVDATAGVAAFVGVVPFTGRRAAKVACLGPSGSIATIRVVGRTVSLDKLGLSDIAMELGADAYTTAAASAQWVAPSTLAGKLQSQARYLGGTDSLEMWDELHLFVNADATGFYSFLVEVSDEVNG
jgi:hypothetical protein